MHVAHVDELLQVVGDVRAEIVAARLQFAGRQLAVADVVEQQRLHAIELGAAEAIELVLDHVEQKAVQPLDQSQRLQILAAETSSVRAREGAPHQTQTHNAASLCLTHPVIPGFDN